MTKILGLSGKKASGKTTASNWIIGQQMCSVNMVSWIKINERGQLVVPAVVDNELTEGIFDPLTNNHEAQTLLSQYVWPVVKLYSFADILKLSCMAIFGLKPEQVNGTNDEKNAPTRFTWKMFKSFLSIKTKKEIPSMDAPVSGRQILQIVGTDIFRKIHGDIWVEACLKQVADERPELAVITDCRFPNEVQGIQRAGGKVIRFTRSPYQDEHVSETALDNYDGFDYVLDNSEMSIEEQNEAMNRILSEWDYNTWDWSEI